MDDLRLVWPRPATTWAEAAPIGNGRLGAMVFGGVGRSRFQINDSTVWSGTPDGPAEGLAEVLAAGAGPDRLAEVRAAIRNKDYRRAESLLMSFEGRYSQEYLPFVDLWMSLNAGEFRRRSLNLDNGVVHEDLGNVQRRTWASRPAQAICIEITADSVDMQIELTSPLKVVHRTGLTLGIEIPVDGAPEHEDGVAELLRYGHGQFGAVAVKIETDGVIDCRTVRGLSWALVTLASSTTAADFWSGRSPRSRQRHLDEAEGTAARALEIGLLRDHEADLRPLLRSTVFDLGGRRGGDVDVEADVLSGKDEQLTATVMFQLGRYLLASASRPQAGPPANLQGIWNEELRPAWSSNYTININTQMNYWAAESAGLSECHLPLIDLIERLSDSGGQVAKELYGARGWVAHHNTDMWGWALPVGMGHGNPSWAIWMMGGVWLAQHVWDHFDFTGDVDFLRARGWPLLSGCAEFCLDWLVDGEDGWLDTIPSTSPENLFISAAGTVESLTYSTTMDMSLIRALFTRCLSAAEVLGLEADPVCAEIRAALPRLRQPPIAAGGWLQEWAEDFTEEDPAHRHMSQMIAIYPLDQATPELEAAAACLLDRRGDGSIGWSLAWKIALGARLGDASTARDLLLEATRPNVLLPNLFSTHPPFQIDGNYGFTAAIVEMVVQSHGDVIEVLPAVPSQWPDGSVTGIRCRGGLSVDVVWSAGELVSLTVRRLGGEQYRMVRLRYREDVNELLLAVGDEVTLLW